MPDWVRAQKKKKIYEKSVTFETKNTKKTAGVCCKMTVRNINDNKWAGAENDVHTPLIKKKMFVLDDIVQLWTGERGRWLLKQIRQPVKQSILTQLLFCWCATWLNNRVTGPACVLPCHCFSSIWTIQETCWSCGRSHADLVIVGQTASV